MLRTSTFGIGPSWTTVSVFPSTIVSSKSKTIRNGFLVTLPVEVMVKEETKVGYVIEAFVHFHRPSM